MMTKKRSKNLRLRSPEKCIQTRQENRNEKIEELEFIRLQNMIYAIDMTHGGKCSVLWCRWLYCVTLTLLSGKKKKITIIYLTDQ